MGGYGTGDGAHCGHQRHLVITDHERNLNESTTNSRVHESCVGATCSRSPSPIRREFWESNKPLPDIAIRRKEQALKSKLRVEGEQQSSGARVIVRQGRPRCRGRQSRDPLFVYNDASESGSSIEVNLRSHHTPEPRRPRSKRSSPEQGHGNLSLDLDLNDTTEGCRVVTLKNNSCPNSPRSVKFSLDNSDCPNSPRVVVNDCASLCCPKSRSPSPCPPRQPCQFQDRACSPLVRSRSRSPCLKRSRSHSRSSSQGSAEIHGPERCVKVDSDDDGSVNIHISSDEGEPPCIPCPLIACCQSSSRTPTPRCSRSRSPPLACRSNSPHSQTSVEISSDDDDVQVQWTRNDVCIQVDLENSDHCSTPRRGDVRCSRSPPKSRSRSRSPRPPWDNATLPCGKGALRLDRPPSPVYKSRSPSRSRSRSASPKCRTPRSIEIHSSDDTQPCVKVDWGYPSESVDSHSTSGSPQRRVCYTPCRSRCSTPAKSKCSSSRSRSRSRSSSPRGVQRRCIEIRAAAPDGPQVTIHRDYLSSSSEGCTVTSEAYTPCTPRVTMCRSRSKTPPCVTVCRSRSATPPHSRAITTCVSNAICRPTCPPPPPPCLPCEPVSSCCSSPPLCCCNTCNGVTVVTSCACHGGDHHHQHHHSSDHCNLCHQLYCHCTCASSVASISSSTCLSCTCRPTNCIRSYNHPHGHHHHHVQEPEPYCAHFCPAPGDIVIRAHQRQCCPHSGKDDGQVELLSHSSACELMEGDTIVRLGKFDSTGRWCASDVVGMYMLGSHGLWIFLGEEEGHECLKPLQADQHQVVRTVNKWFRPRLGDLIIHTLPGPHSFYFWNPKKRQECDDTRLLLRAYIGMPHVVDDFHNLACCTASHLPVGYAELYVNVRNQWLFLGRDDHMFTECEITSS